MGKLSATMKIEVSYDKEMPITIRRFPTEFEIKELKKYERKLVDEEIKIVDNEITIKIYNERKSNISKTISGGNYDFTQKGPPGTFIEIKIKHPEEKIVDTIIKIVRELCKKHLEPCVLFPSRYTISCTVNNFQPSTELIQNFFLDFIKEVEKNIKSFKITHKEEKVEYKDLEICDRCKGEFPKQEMKKITLEKNKFFNYCPTCYEIETNVVPNISKAEQVSELLNPHRSNPKSENSKPKMKLKWKITIGVLTLIACGILILAIGSIVGIL